MSNRQFSRRQILMAMATPFLPLPDVRAAKPAAWSRFRGDASNSGCGAASAAKGQELWKFRTQGCVHSSPVINRDGMVFIGSDDGKLYSLDAKTGRKFWEFGMEEPILATPGIGPGNLLLCGGMN